MEIAIEGHIDGVKIKGTKTVTVSIHTTEEVGALVTAYCLDRSIQPKDDYIIKTQHGDVLHNSRLIETCGLRDGDRVYLVSKRKKKLEIFGCNNWWINAFIALLLGSVGMVTICIAKNVLDGVTLYKYVVVANAQNDVLEVTIYNWNAAKLNGTGFVHMPWDRCSLKGGLLAYNQEPELAGKHLTQCLQSKAVSKAISENIKDKDIMFCYGASSNLIALRNSSAIINNIKKSLKKTRFSEFTSNVTILNKFDEVTYTWISANYLSGHLLKPNLDPWNPGSVEIIKMDSVQMEYVYTGSPEGSFATESKRLVRVFGNLYMVFSVVNKCYGWSVILKKKSALIVKEQYGEINSNEQSIIIVKDPCISNQTNRTIQASEILSPFCDVGLSYHSSKAELTNVSITFVGTGSWKACTSIVERLITNMSGYNYNIPLRKEHSKPMTLPVVTDIVSLLKKKHFKGTTFSLANLTQTVNEECNQADKSSVTDHGLIESNLCFFGVYLYQVLDTRYQFTDEMWGLTEFKSKIQNEEIDWPLGYVLHLSTSLPPESAVKYVTQNLFMAIGFICIVVMIISIGFACKARSITTNKYEKKKRAYQKLSSTSN